MSRHTFYNNHILFVDLCKNGNLGQVNLILMVGQAKRDDHLPNFGKWQVLQNP